jgi:hypothetical protein
MDDETRQHLEAMEARLMSRITGAQEALIERMRLSETAIAGLIELTRSTNTLTSILAGLMTDVGRRVTDLEKKP